MASLALDATSRASHAPRLEAHPILQHGSERGSRSSASSSSQAAMKAGKEKDHSRPKANSDASRGTGTSSSTHSEYIGQGKVRYLPRKFSISSTAMRPALIPFAAWINSFEEDDGEMPIVKPKSNILSAPLRAHAADHHYAPVQLTKKVSHDGYIEEYDEAAHGLVEKTGTGFFGGHRDPVKGRKWDHARDAEPVIVRLVNSKSSPWSTFVKSSLYGRASGEDSKIVSYDYLQNQTPGYEKPWRGDLESNDDPQSISGLLHNKKQRRTFIQRMQVCLLYNLV